MIWAKIFVTEFGVDRIEVHSDDDQDASLAHTLHIALLSQVDSINKAATSVFKKEEPSLQ